MEARKTKHIVLKLVLHYVLYALVVSAAITAYYFRHNISNYFASDLTSSEAFNAVLHKMPALITSLELIVLAAVINTFLSLMAQLKVGFTDKGKTIINLINSLLKWVVIIATILLILSVWGVNTTTLLAGAGIVALVIGLGAQSLIADILAGIFIVIESKFVVGDIVVIEGWRGKVISIGIRTTELQDIGGNIKIINNSEIRSIVNQTKLQSVASVSINISAQEPLEKVEAIINEALPEIRKNIPAITEDIIYKGITNISDITIELLFGAKCYEEDLYQVQRDLHRQLKLLLDKNKIECFAPPTYNITNGK